MSAPKRVSLRDMNRIAITESVPQAPQETPQSKPSAPQVKTKEITRPKIVPDPPKRQAVTAVAGEGVTVLSITVRPEDLELAKAAYMADWISQGLHDRFPDWLGAAVQQHAALNAAERARIANERPPKTTKRGLKRAFKMNPADVEAMRRTIADDFRTTGMYLSEADWCGDALRVAINAARQRAGGELPPAPTRLPNRMPARQ
jgi:hypothetical protein